HPGDHQLKRIFGLRVHAVRVNADESYALRGVLLCRCAGYLVRPDDIRAVVAGEEHDQDPSVLEAVQRIRTAVRCRQIEVRRLLAELQCECHGNYPLLAVHYSRFGTPGVVWAWRYGRTVWCGEERQRFCPDNLAGYSP